MHDILLTTADAARRLAVAPTTMTKWRLRGEGPRWRKIGAHLVRYAAADLDAFIAERVRRSTSESSAA